MVTKKDVIAAEFYYRYLNLVPEDDVVKALKKSGRRLIKLLKKIPKKKIDFAYASDKWTLKEVLQHIIDAERVFSFRALWFARKEGSPLPGFEEKDWGAQAQAVNRKWNELIEEFEAVRKSNVLFFGPLKADQLLSAGVASNHNINVLAFGYICSGHVLHHINIIKERYL